MVGQVAISTAVCVLFCLTCECVACTLGADLSLAVHKEEGWTARGQGSHGGSGLFFALRPQSRSVSFFCPAAILQLSLVGCFWRQKCACLERRLDLVCVHGWGWGEVLEWGGVSGCVIWWVGVSLCVCVGVDVSLCMYMSLSALCVCMQVCCVVDVWVCHRECVSPCNSVCVCHFVTLCVCVCVCPWQNS